MMTKAHFAGGWIHGDEPFAGKEHGLRGFIDGGEHGRGVTGRFLRGTPAHLAAGDIQSDDAGLGTADVKQHGVAHDQRRAGESEESLRSLELGASVQFPESLTGFQIPRVHHAVGSMGEDAAAGNGGHGSRAVVESEIIHVIGAISRTPDRLAGDGVQAVDDFLMVEPVKEDELVLGHGRPGKAGPDLRLPELLRTGGWPGGEGLALIGSITARAEKLRPIFGA